MQRKISLPFLMGFPIQNILLHALRLIVIYNLKQYFKLCSLIILNHHYIFASASADLLHTLLSD